MKRQAKAWLGVLLAGLVTSALAADNLLVVDPGSTVVTRSHDTGGGVQIPLVAIGDFTGATVLGTVGTPNSNVFTVQGAGGGTALPVSLASTPLPSGAALASKQPAIGTAGTASADVLTVQGVASMTPLAGNLTQVNGTTILAGTGAVGAGAPRVAVAVDAATLAGSVPGAAGSPSAQVVSIQGVLSGTPLGIFETLKTAGGYSTFFLQPAASDNHATVKNGSGQVYHITAQNNSATINYLRLYNAGTGFNGCNSATNLVMQVQIPASTSVGSFDASYTAGVPFGSGISICVTSGYATNDTTNATATAMSVTILYN